MEGANMSELVKRLKGSIGDKIEMENTIAKAAQIEAKLEYLAMMEDIDLNPEESEEEE